MSIVDKLHKCHLGLTATQLCLAFIGDVRQKNGFSTSVKHSVQLYSVYSHPYASLASFVWNKMPPIRSVIFNYISS